MTYRQKCHDCRKSIASFSGKDKEFLISTRGLEESQFTDDQKEWIDDLHYTLNRAKEIVLCHPESDSVFVGVPEDSENGLVHELSPEQALVHANQMTEEEKQKNQKLHRWLKRYQAGKAVPEDYV